MNGMSWFKGDPSPSTGGGERRRSNALRVFLVVAALHVVVLGPILLFEGCKSGSHGQQAKVPEIPEPVAPPQEIIAAPVQPAAPAAPVQPAAAAAPPVAAQPAAVTEAAPIRSSAPPPARTYKVQAGDSLWKIAKNERVSIADLMRANNLTDKSVLRVGQTLQIPAATISERAAATAPAAPLPAGATEYVVQSGDSLWAIARKHNTSVNALKETNRLTTSTLRVGQKLIIPAAAPSAAPTTDITPGVDPLTGGTIREGDKTYHYVGVNEALETIAKRYGVAPKEIMRANAIQKADAIRAGDRLLIPVKAQAPAPAAPEAKAPPPPPLG
jgi:peptidoglycan endopeptidase LytF